MRLQDAELSNDIVRLIGVDSVGILRATNDIVSGAHDHDNTYAPLEHDHDADYAPSVHGHPEYSPVHDHPYAGSEHNHGSVYAALAHNHNTAYSPLGHTHNYAPQYHVHPNGFSYSEVWLCTVSQPKTVNVWLSGAVQSITLYQMGSPSLAFVWDKASGLWSNVGGVYANALTCVSTYDSANARWQNTITLSSGFQSVNYRYALIATV